MEESPLLRVRDLVTTFRTDTGAFRAVGLVREDGARD